MFLYLIISSKFETAITLALCTLAVGIFGKIIYLLAVKPAKKCGGDSPLHPLFVCNGEVDCLDGRDEVNCTLGVNACSCLSLYLSSAWKDTWTGGLMPFDPSSVMLFLSFPARNCLLRNPIPVQQRLLHPEEERQV